MSLIFTYNTTELSNMIDHYNWRGLFDIKNENSVEVILSDFKCMKLLNTTIDDFNESNYSSNDLVVRGSFVGISLRCPQCKGEGLTDWISAVVSKDERISNIKYNFKYLRDPEKEVYLFNHLDSYSYATAYMSQQIIPESMMHCKSCLGTGLYLTSKLLKFFKPPTLHKFERC